MSGGSSRARWGWTPAVRGLLAVFAVGGSLGLLCLSSPPARAPVPVPQLVVDPNSAPAAVLEALPKLGPSLVARMVTAREEAPFRSMNDIDARVRGIGPATAEALGPYFRFGAETGKAHEAGSSPNARGDR